MVKRSFIGLKKPRLKYDPVDARQPELKNIPTPNKVTLLLDKPYNRRDSILFRTGDTVKTGQKLSYSDAGDAYVISTVTGTISAISSFVGDYGRMYTAVTIDVADSEESDDVFRTQTVQPALDTAKNFLAGAPGNPSFKFLSDPEKPIHTLIICGVDRDLLITTNQYVLKSQINAIKSGVRVLKSIAGIDAILIAVPQHLMQDAAGSGAEVRVIDSEYPAALPKLMIQKILGRIVPAGQTCEDLGVCFISAEAVASIGRAFDQGHIPVAKTFTFIDKNGSKTMASARIGTPVSEVLKAFDVTLKEKDRVIFGGPMTGSAVYSEDYPVQADTDAIIVQESDKIPLVADYPCINCGECVRICPANVPVNMLVRFLEAGKYETAADEYDLYSCIECGLCSYVCVSRMPVYHYIKLGKYELERIRTAEATNA
ncbi:MAG: 4Fe-4S dicluster domain-containing protein [Pseudomonadota bacterium]